MEFPFRKMSTYAGKAEYQGHSFGSNKFEIFFVDIKVKMSDRYMSLELRGKY